MEKKKHPSNKESLPRLFPKGLILFSLCIFLFLSFCSFYHHDPQQNWLGIIGYIVSWIFQYLFGFSSYLFIFFLAWIAFSYLSGKKIPHMKWKVFYFSLLTISSCFLLNLAAENFPIENEVIKTHCYSEEFVLNAPFPHRFIRYNLGGVPFYFLYQDLPLFNLHHLLSNVGVVITFSLIAAVSLILLTEMKILFFLKNFSLGLYAFAKWSPTLFRAFKRKSPEELQTGKEEVLYPPQDFKARPLYAKKAFPIAHKKPKVFSKTAAGEEPPAWSFSPPAVPIKTLPKKEKSKSVNPPIEEQKKNTPEPGVYQLPSEDLISEAKKIDTPSLNRELQRQAEILEETLLSFGIEAKVGQIHCGPTITSFEVHPAVGVKVQKIKALSNDIALNLQAKSIRIIAPIPGKAAVGVEVPSLYPQEVGFREMLADYHKGKTRYHIPILLGKTVSGENVMCDLTRMPHCIIAGATGSGKSVCINTIIMSIIMNAKPDQTKLILVDPKKVELTPYSPLPHMIAPVITEATGAYAALNWLVKEMQYRYDILKQLGLRNIHAFNHRKRDQAFEESLKIPIPEKLFYIVCIIDEFADLMMTSSTDLETPIARIAQMARAVGIHLILATQRPSREVITGLIKANFPTRISFKVSSRVNSQIILDENGAETLLGNGDMLFLPPGSHQLIRAQGVYIRDEDINRIIEHTCRQAPAEYLIKSFDAIPKEDIMFQNGEEGDDPKDSLYDKALSIILDTRNASTTFLQRKLKIGYARAASLMDELESRGVVGPSEGSRPRKILLTGQSPLGEDEEDFEG
ncbi:MAG: DNA translocase FtsK [Simkaniaceae bacterium]